MAGKIKFQTVLLGNSADKHTGIEVPPDVVEKLGQGKRPPVKVNLNGYNYRNTVAVMGGKFLISVSADVCKNAKVKGGEKHDVTLELDTEPRVVELPDDFKKALNKNAAAKAFYGTLSYSSQQRYVLPIGQAKTEETRNRRIEKAVVDLAAKKKV